MPDQPQTTEPVPVQLTRIEGTVNLIAYQMTEVKAEVGGVKTELATLRGRVAAIELVQAASSGGSNWLKAWLPTLIAAIGVAVALGFGVKFN